jgi:epoxyqueuosine reductase
MITGIMDSIKQFNIEFIGAIPFSECKVIKKHLLTFKPENAIIFLVPYFYHDYDRQNVSHYAVVRDYHIFFHEIFSHLEDKYQGYLRSYNIKGFSDHSPIDEVNAAAKAGLGIIGENGLLINKIYGSYVFIGEVFTDIDAGELFYHEIIQCSDCGACYNNCPSHDICLSALTQKKGVLTMDEKQQIKRNGYVWGCDVCQNVCPYNRKIKPTPIDFFQKDRLPYLNIETIKNMSDDEFNQRAYSWRKRQVIMRNIEICNPESN